MEIKLHFNHNTDVSNDLMLLLFNKKKMCQSIKHINLIKTIVGQRVYSDRNSLCFDELGKKSREPVL